MQDTIREQLELYPARIGEDHGEGDLYSQVFKDTRRSRMHGFGLIVGGKSTQQLDQAMGALKYYREENLELRSVIANMESKYAQYELKSQEHEAKLNVLLNRQQTSTQQTRGTAGQVDGSTEDA